MIPGVNGSSLDISNTGVAGTAGGPRFRSRRVTDSGAVTNGMRGGTGVQTAASRYVPPSQIRGMPVSPSRQFAQIVDARDICEQPAAECDVRALHISGEELGRRQAFQRASDPTNGNVDGRDHNRGCWTRWMAGGESMHVVHMDGPTMSGTMSSRAASCRIWRKL